MRTRFLVRVGVVATLIAGVGVVAEGPASAAFTGRVDTGGAALQVYLQPTPYSSVRGTIANGSSISLQCGVNSVAASGKYGSSTLWHQVVFSSQIGWVNDSNVYTGSSSLPAGEPWCAKGTVRTSSGGSLEVRSAPTTSAGFLGVVAYNSVQLLYCGANGSSASGPWGSSTLWHQIGFGSTVGWVPDASLLTNYSSLPPGEIWCPSVPSTVVDRYSVSGVFKTARDRNGVSNVGGSTNAVHRWGAGNVQDFDGGAWGWNIIMQADSDPSAAFDVRSGFWNWYRQNSNQGMSILGYPKSDEFGCGSGSARQFFEKGQLWYNASLPAYQVTAMAGYVNSVPFNRYTGNGRKVVDVVRFACQYAGSARLPNGALAAGQGNCVNAVWQMFTYGLGYAVTGNGWTYSWDIWNGIGANYVNGTQMRWPRTSTDSMLNPPAGTVALFGPATANGNGGHAVLVIGGRSPDGSAYVMSTDVAGGWGISTIQNYVNAFGISKYYGAVRFAG